MVYTMVYKRGSIFGKRITSTMQLEGVWRLFLGLLAAALISGCAETQFVMQSAKQIMGPVESEPQPEDQTSVEYKIGKPYQISGVWYYPQEDFEYDETGIASWYGAKFHGRKTANGEVYDMNTLTAAHRTLPMPSFVRVTNLENGRSLILRVNDRGPFARGRIIDISRRGSQLLGFQKQGTARVRVQVLADRTRAIKARIRNQADLAKVGSPITVDRLPKAKVQSQSLPPPGSSEPVAEVLPTVQKQPTPPPPSPITPDAGKEFDLSGKITQGAKIRTNIYVQAGAFSLFDNASRVRARLAPLGDVKLTQVLVNGKDLYRVRVGPLADVNTADRLLVAVAEAGYKNARVIVD
jgi:rare lipoprotein A